MGCYFNKICHFFSIYPFLKYFFFIFEYFRSGSMVKGQIEVYFKKRSIRLSTADLAQNFRVTSDQQKIVIRGEISPLP